MTTPALAIPAAARGADPTVLAALRSASDRTGVDFAYLVAKAGQESSFDPNAKASTSSATGLFQFIDQTWLGMVKRHGAAFGLEAEAAAIRESNGRFSVDPADKARIMGLRTDPAIASLMGAQFAKDNESYLERTIGGEIGGTELYLAHFLGPAGASKFISAWRENPNATAARIFPAEAAANRGVFYKDGTALSLDAIRTRFGRLFSADAPISVAAAPPLAPPVAAPEPQSLFTRAAEETLLREPAPPPVAGGFSQVMGDAIYARTLSTLLLAQMGRDERYGI